MSRLGLEFKCVSPNCDEAFYKVLNLSPKEIATRIAYEKAKSVFYLEENAKVAAFVIGSDQVVALDRLLLGKPRTIDEACASLNQCSGKTIVLTTAVCVLGPQIDRQFEVSATMTFKNLSESEVLQYVEKDLPLDCAGSFKYESIGRELFVDVQCDDPSAIEGLPLKRLTAVLKQCGFVNLPKI